MIRSRWALYCSASCQHLPKLATTQASFNYSKMTLIHVLSSLFSFYISHKPNWLLGQQNNKSWCEWKVSLQLAATAINQKKADVIGRCQRSISVSISLNLIFLIKLYQLNGSTLQIDMFNINRRVSMATTRPKQREQQLQTFMLACLADYHSVEAANVLNRSMC